MSIRTLDINELNSRLSELESLRDAVSEERDNLKDATDDDREEIQARLDDAESDFGQPEQDELKELEALKDAIGERGGKIDDENGPFIHDEDFEDYARELADDIGAIPRDAGWPTTFIDWPAAAEALKQDYSSVEWGGETYLYRA